MACSVTATANGPSKRKGPANANGNGDVKANANGALAEAHVDDAADRDFFWTYTEEPHRTRRLAIIKAHPEVCLAQNYNPSSRFG
jgi:sphingolipid delta-4 desaturase